MGPDSAAAISERMAAVEATMRRFSTGRRFFNFTPSSDPSSAIDPAALTRLREIKRRRDPLGVIRSNRPVVTAPAPLLPRQRSASSLPTT